MAKLELVVPGFRFPTTMSPAQRRQAAMDFLRATATVMSLGYGPAPYRTEQGWKLAAAEGRARRAIEDLETVSDVAVQRIIKGFIDEMRDGHTDVTAADTRKAVLPFSAFRTSEGRLEIATVDTARLPQGATLRPGEDIVSLDGRPIDEVMAELTARERQTNDDYAAHSAQQTLTYRLASYIHDVPELGAPATLVVRAVDGTERTVALRWLDSAGAAESPFDSGATRGYPEAFGPMARAQRDGDPFQSYVYTLNGRRIGYVRISTFSPVGADGEEDSGTADVDFVRRYQALMREMADTTDALIVDLTNSTGGSTTVENLLSASMSAAPLRAALDPLRNTARLKQETQQRLAQLASGVPADDLTNLFTDPEQVRRNEKAYLTQLLRELDEGRPWTSLAALDGMPEVPPAKQPYRRPVVFVVNPGTVSSSESMPAKFQDNRDRRPFTTVVGTRTGGLGGTIEEVTFPNPFGIVTISYTESLSIRMNGTPVPEDIPPERLIESRGVIPDRRIALTSNDLRNDFADYRRDVNAVVMEQIQAYERIHGRRSQRSQ